MLLLLVPLTISTSYPAAPLLLLLLQSQSFHHQFFFRLVNSAAHYWGDKPYDTGIAPSQNRLVALLAVGEGFHNYHHVFPHDYSASEWTYSLNATTFFIDCMAALGMAHGRRSVSKEAVEARMKRTGQGSSNNNVSSHEEKDY